MTEDDDRAGREFQELVRDYDAQARDAEIDRDALERIDVRSEGFFEGARRRFVRNRLAVLGVFVLIAMVIMSIVVPAIADESAYERTFAEPTGPSAEHWFGTTRTGQDMWTIVWEGGRISLSVGFAVAIVIFLVGTAYGSIAGYFGGALDNLMMRLLDSLYGLPYVPLAAIIVVLFRELAPDASAILYLTVALSVVSWFTAARLMRGQMLIAREQPYVEAAQAEGASGGRIIRRHLLRNTLGVLVIAAFLEVPAAIIGEAILSFLGLGVPPGEPSWGALANQGAGQMDRHPMLIIAPGMMIALAVLSATAIADGLRDALDVRSDTK